MITHGRSDGISRRELIKVGAQAAAIAAAGDLLAACGGGTTAATGAGSATKISPGPSATGTPVRGGTLIVGVTTAGSAETIDPRKITNEPDIVRGPQLYDNLFAEAPGGIAPQLAISAEPNKQATVWTFTLRDGVTFHNGKPLTADDVIYSIKASWDSPASYERPLAASLIDIKRIRKLDRLRVEIPLLRPMAQFPSVTSFQNCPIIPDGTTDFNKGIGTGPFRLVAFTPGSSSTMAANRDYWDHPPYIDELVINSSYTDDPARLNAVLSKEIHIAPGVPPALAKANAGSSAVVFGNVPAPQFVAITLRVNLSPFTDPRVVQALKLLTDREAIVNDAFDGYATVGNDCPGATWQYYASDIKPMYDPEKAKSLLKAAGQEHLARSVVTSPVVPGLVETATLWSSQAAAIGLNFPVRQLSTAVFYDPAHGFTTNSRPVGSSVWNSIPSGLAALYLTILTAQAPFPETGWGLRPGQGTLLDEALAELDPTKAKAKWHAVQEQQAQAGGYIIPANPNWLDAYGPTVRGVQTNAAGPCSNFRFNSGWLTS